MSSEVSFLLLIFLLPSWKISKFVCLSIFYQNNYRKYMTHMRPEFVGVNELMLNLLN